MTARTLSLARRAHLEQQTQQAAHHAHRVDVLHGRARLLFFVGRVADDAVRAPGVLGHGWLLEMIRGVGINWSNISGLSPRRHNPIPSGIEVLRYDPEVATSHSNHNLSTLSLFPSNGDSVQERYGPTLVAFYDAGS